MHNFRNCGRTVPQRLREVKQGHEKGITPLHEVERSHLSDTRPHRNFVSAAFYSFLQSCVTFVLLLF